MAINTTTRRMITKATQREFVTQLKSAVVEKDVEAAYKGIFQKYYQTTFPSPYGSDGYIEEKQAGLFDEGLRLLLEAKFNLDLTKANERAKIAAQSIYYLKKFEADGKQLPNVIVGGDENELFTLYAPKLKEYLNRNYDWSIAPSSAWKENEPLYRELLDDPNLSVFVFDVRSSAFDINEVFRSIDALAQQNGEFAKLRVTEANLRLVFDEFVRIVFGSDNWLVGTKKIGAEDTVSIFIQSILGSKEIYIVPTKKNVLHLSSGREITINASNYDAFFSRYDRKYTVKEIDAITAIADQLIEEVKRRFHGDFWTPTVWANRAIEMMTHDLGADWREKYVVWDPAAGTKNLTRDYTFKNLFTSTLHQAEIDMSTQYNQEAVSFQYDFLNDDIDVNPNSDPRDLKMPRELFEALKNDEPIIFYTNPPYGQTGGLGSERKSGIAQNRISDLMRSEGMGHASSELYTNFIFRVQKVTNDFNLSNVFFFFFFNKGFLTSPAFGKFTDQLLDQFTFNDGFMLNAGEFQGTSSNWGIIFSNFENKKDTNERQRTFEFSVEKSGLDGIEQITTHILDADAKNATINAWLAEVRLPKNEFNDGKYPRYTGGFNITKGNTKRGYLREGAIGYIESDGISIQRADKYTNLNTSMLNTDNGSSVLPINFERACVDFGIKKSILSDASWINDKDVFRKPSEEFQASSEWPEFVHDCVVFSLFQKSSYQTSLRNFEYNDELYNVPNEWFFMSKNDSITLAEKYNLNDIVFDARSADERFVYRYLQDKKLSSEARELLSMGKELVEKTYAKRFIANQEHPEWHLNTWYAGYYQAYKITTMFKVEFAELMQEFNAARTALETKIRNRVYKDSILSK